jgi:hypothetical protein
MLRVQAIKKKKSGQPRIHLQASSFSGELNGGQNLVAVRQRRRISVAPSNGVLDFQREPSPAVSVTTRLRTAQGRVVARRTQQQIAQYQGVILQQPNSRLYHTQSSSRAAHHLNRRSNNNWSPADSNPFPIVPLPNPPQDVAGNYLLPPEIDKIFCISIDETRWQAFVARAGPWISQVEKLDGTNGRSVVKMAWIRQNFLSNSNMTRGQMGCYDSHVRIWEMMKNNRWKNVLVLEDDGDFRYSAEMAALLRRIFDEAAERHPNWDIFYLGRNPQDPRNFARVGRDIVVPRSCQTFHAYVINRKACKALLERAWPISVPVDVLASDLSDSGKMNALAAEQSIIKSLNFGSDTNRIR